jgi:chitinase
MKSGKPSETRAPESAHTSAQTSRDSFTGCSSQVQARADEPRPKRQCRRPEKHVVRTTAIRDVAPPQPKIAGLDCANNPQPCLHYRSIIRQHPGTAYALNTCPYLNEPRGPDLGYKKAWEAQHPDGVKWREPKADGGLIPDRPPHEDPTINTRGCEPDEWPPYALYHEVDNYSKVIDPDFAMARRMVVSATSGDVNQSQNAIASSQTSTVSSEPIGQRLSIPTTLAYIHARCTRSILTQQIQTGMTA